MNRKTFLYYLSILILSMISPAIYAQDKFSKHELSINLFRNPSIGLEYRYRSISMHGGYYLTKFESGKTWKFIKTGISYWLLPIGKKSNPSSFYMQLSYLRGLNRDYKGMNAFSADIGFRAMLWKGLQARLGVIAIATDGKQIKVNPTPSINYSFFFD